MPCFWSNRTRSRIESGFALSFEVSAADADPAKNVDIARIAAIGWQGLPSTPGPRLGAWERAEDRGCWATPATRANPPDELIVELCLICPPAESGASPGRRYADWGGPLWPGCR